MISRLAAFAYCALTGCATEFREPQATAHASDAYVEVPYLPPAALVEVAGDPPNSACVWFDGHWVWRGKQYVWKRGGWVSSRPDLYYAPWKTAVLPDGRLLFAEGTWYGEDGRRAPVPEIIKPARTPANEVTSEFEAPR